MDTIVADPAVEVSTPSSLPAAFTSSTGGAPATDTGPALMDRLVGHEVLAFRLGGEEYAIDILRVQEIRSYEPPTRLANAPAFLKGVVNLRGEIVPVIDLRLKFSLQGHEGTDDAVVIVLNVCRRVVGVVVDAVSDVVRLATEHLRAVPEFSSSWENGHLLAIATIDERNLILVDVEKVLSSHDMGLVDQALH